MSPWSALLAAVLGQDAVAERARDPESGHTYVRTAEPLAFADAERVAKGMGGTLLSIQSAEEETFVLDNFGAGEGYWLGLEFPRTSWADGAPLAYTHWATGMPSGSNERSFTVLNWSEPGAWGDVGGDAEVRYRALIEFASGVEPGIVPPLGVARRARRGVLLVALQGLSAKELQNARLPNLHGLFERAAWTLDAGADGSADPLAGLGLLTWGVGSTKSGLASAHPENAARQKNENLLSRLERSHPEITTAALFDDAALSGILLDGRIDLRVGNASARRGGAPEPVRDALARPTPLCVLATFTSLTLQAEEPSEASRSKEIAEIDRELGTLLEGLRARPGFADEEWWIAVAGLAPPAPRKGKAPEGRARTAVPLLLVAPEIPAGEILGEVGLADLVPSALQFLELEPRPSFGLDGRVLRLGARPALGSNLLTNPGAEAQLTYESGAYPLVPGWRVLAPFRLARHGKDAGLPAGGVNYFAGQDDTLARLEQTLDLTPLAAEIDRGSLRFTLSGWLGGQKQAPATIDLFVEFLGESKKVQDSAHAGPVGLAERRALLGVDSRGIPKEGFVERSAAGKVPRRARAARIVLVAEGASGVKETMADALSFVLTSE